MRGLPGWESKLPAWEAGEELATRRGVRARSLDAVLDVVPGSDRRRADLTGNTGTALDGAPVIATHEFGGRQRPLRHPRARHGRDHERHGGERAAARGRHVLRLQRLHARRGAARRALAVQVAVRVDARLGRPRRGRSRPTSRSSTSRRCGRCPGCASSAPPTPTRCAQAWRVHIDGDGPTAIDPHPPEAARCSTAPPSAAPEGVAAGAYVLVDEDGDDLDLVLIGTGSEVSLCVAALRPARPTAVGAGRVDAVVGPLRRAVRRLPRAGAPARRADARGRGGRHASVGSATPTTSSASTASARRRPARSPWSEFGFTPEQRRRACTSRCVENRSVTSMTQRDRPTQRLRAEPVVRQPRPAAAHRRRAAEARRGRRHPRASRRTPRSSTRRSAPARATTSSSRECAQGRAVDRGHLLGRRARRHRRRRPTCCARCYDAARRRRRLRVGRGRRPSSRTTPTARSQRPRSLHDRVDRPNVMIKIPATLEGLPAIEETIAAGHQRQRHADLLARPPRRGDRGLPRRARALRRRAAATSSTIASVASFFVSRVDTETDRRLPEGSPLRGKAAVANAKLAYELFRERFSGPRWDALAAKGARLQRPLWASTSTKNPAYSPTLYVDELIGPDTVNTLAPASIEALQRGEGNQRADTVTEDVDEAHAGHRRSRRRRRRLRRRHRHARARRRRLVRRVVPRRVRHHREAPRRAHRSWTTRTSDVASRRPCRAYVVRDSGRTERRTGAVKPSRVTSAGPA